MKYFLMLFMMMLLLFSCGMDNKSRENTPSSNIEPTEKEPTNAPNKNQVELEVDPLSPNDLVELEGETYTFTTKDEQTVFVFNQSTKKGRIKLNGSLLRVKKMDRFDEEKKMVFYGDDLEIFCNSIQWLEEGEGGDCSHALCGSIDIKYGNEEVGVPFANMTYCYIGGF